MPILPVSVRLPVGMGRGRSGKMFIAAGLETIRSCECFTKMGWPD